MQEIALTYQQVLKLFTFSLFVAGIWIYRTCILCLNLDVSYYRYAVLHSGIDGSSRKHITVSSIKL
jgi:hypothetical protein